MFLIALVLLFIIRLRYPPGESISSIIIRRHGRPTLQLYRTVERLDLKLRKAELDRQYLTICSNNNLVPNFLNFKLPNNNLQNSRLYRNCQKRFLNDEIKEKTSKINSIKNRLNNTLSSLKSSVSFIDFTHFTHLIERTNSNTIAHNKFIQDRKLQKLGYVNPDGLPTSKVIFNFSSRPLNSAEESLLRKGLNFALPTRKINYLSHFLPFELLYKRITNCLFFPFQNKTPEFFKNSLKHLAFSTYYSKKSFNSVLTEEENKALHSLKNDKSIIITKPDKGNGIVVLDKSVYIEKMNCILNDQSKFCKVLGDTFSLILKCEDRINNFLRKLKSSKTITDALYSHLYVSGSRPGILYGSPKVHKPNVPLRPILSAIGTVNYKLAKYLVPILSPITFNKYTVKDSFSFAKEICNTKIYNCTMASFDVKSLFTNIPLDETVNICVEQLFKNCNLVNGYNKKDFHKLLSLAVKDSLFTFNNEIYKQTDGVAMGNPLGPTLANAFLAYYESTWIENCPSEFKPIMYRRYIDDTFITFASPEHVALFLNYLNSQHNNIEFTYETEEDNKLNFLDVMIEKTATNFCTSIYRKPTYTGLTTKFNSNIPIQYKKNLICTLVTRAFNICSSFQNIHLELDKLRHTLKANGFPLNFTDTYIGKQLEKLMNPPPIITTVNKVSVHFIFPFLGSHSFGLKNKLRKLISEHYPQVSLRVIFKPTNLLSHYFKFKDNIPDALLSSVVYKFNCSICNSAYIGQTKRHLATRIAEHRGLSVRTALPLSRPPFSAVRDHSEASGHPLSHSDFSVLFSSTDDSARLVAESLLTHSLKPNLGTHESSTPLLCF